MPKYKTQDDTMYIYALFDPREPEIIRYIGKTCNIEKRLKGHIYEAARKKKKLTYKNNWIRKIINEGVMPQIRIIETTNSNECNDREIYWIAQNKYNKYFTNSTLGGEGGTMAEDVYQAFVIKMNSEERIAKLKLSLSLGKEKRSARMKERMSQPENIENLRNKMTQNNPFKGKRHSEETRKLISEQVKKKMTPEITEKIRISKIGTKRTEESKRKQSESIKGISHKPTHHKLNEEDIRNIRIMISDGVSLYVIAEQYGVKRDTIYRIRKGQTWKSVTT